MRTCRDQDRLHCSTDILSLVSSRSPAPSEIRLWGLSNHGPVDHRPGPWKRVHYLLAIQHKLLHSLLTQEQGCSMLTASALSNLKLLLQTHPLAASFGKGSSSGRSRGDTFMCCDRMGLVPPPRDLITLESHPHTHSPANAAGKATAENSKHISSTSWVISAFNCLDDLLQEEGKKKTNQNKKTLLSRIHLCKRHHASACIGNFTKLSWRKSLTCTVRDKNP